MTVKKKEKVPLAIIYKDETGININFTDESRDFELYGFIRTLSKAMEQDLVDSFETKD